MDRPRWSSIRKPLTAASFRPQIHRCTRFAVISGELSRRATRFGGPCPSGDLCTASHVPMRCVHWCTCISQLLAHWQPSDVQLQRRWRHLSRVVNANKRTVINGRRSFRHGWRWIRWIDVDPATLWQSSYAREMEEDNCRQNTANHAPAEILVLTKRLQCCAFLSS